MNMLVGAGLVGAAWGVALLAPPLGLWSALAAAPLCGSAAAAALAAVLHGVRPPGYRAVVERGERDAMLALMAGRGPRAAL